MSQIPHQAATSAIPPSPSKKAKTSSRPRPALRMPTSNVEALTEPCGSRAARPMVERTVESELDKIPEHVALLRGNA